MNTIRFLTPTWHGALDYAAAAGLVIFPFLLGFDGLSLWLSVVGGVGLVLYSLLTDYTFGIAGVISFKTHLALDRSAAAAFVAAPFLFGWSGIVVAYYLVMAGGVTLVVAFTNLPSQKGEATLRNFSAPARDTGHVAVKESIKP